MGIPIAPPRPRRRGVSFRLREETVRQLDDLAAHMRSTRTYALETLVEQALPPGAAERLAAGLGRRALAVLERRRRSA